VSAAPERPGRAYFIAGTDTGVGKTRITVALLTAARAQGRAVAGMKPVAAGAQPRDGRLTSADASQIAAASGQSTPYEELNPYCLLEPISPHIAADRANISVDVDLIVTIASKLALEAELLLIEGAGGWYTPISERASMADLARALGYPVILVVGLKLGCLNHARLTLEAIVGCGCRMVGWVGTQIDPDFAAWKENLATLERLLGSAPLALLPYSSDPRADAPRMREAMLRLLGTQHDPNA
jgi:dethiobiotin synthetase